ncbi:MAG: MFS transporter [Planctomycetes bacterium]|nr:MFS transporter [Planctomycetota bacterium]
MAEATPPAHPPSTRTMRAAKASVLPAIATTFLVGCGFASLKFVLIGRIALDWDPTAPGALDSLPGQWLRDLVLATYQRGGLQEAVSQAMSVVLTLGLLIGFPVNGPLAGSWRCDRLFAISTAAVGFGCLMALWGNPWLWACFIGITYGAACAARGKIVPLLSRSTGGSNTLISGGINAALAIGLVAGTLAGSFISQEIGSDLAKHLILVGISTVGVLSALFIRVPEPEPVPFAVGLADFVRATSVLVRHHWSLLAGGGLAWGITAAASLAMYVHAVDELGLHRGKASTIAGFAAIGAILGNLASHRMAQRRWVIAAFFGLAATLLLYPYVVAGFWSAGAMVFLIGFLFAAPANVLDAKFLANAHEDGLAGLGGTVMSFVHSLAILIIGLSLAVPLLFGWMDATHQFWLLAGIAAASCLTTLFARLDAQK